VRGDRLGLGPGAGRAQQGEAVVDFGPLRPWRAEPDRQVEEKGAEGVAEVGLGHGFIRRPEPFTQVPQQPPPSRKRCASLFVGEGDRRLGLRRQRGEELELVLGQVVEAVEEDGSVAPEGAVAAQLGDRLAGDPVGVDAAGLTAHLLVAAVEGGDVGEVGRALQRRRARLDLLRLHARCLQLAEQALQSAGKARAPRRSLQRPQPPALPGDRHRDGPQPLRGREVGARGGARHRRDGAEETAEGHHRAAQLRAAAAELALESEDVVDGRHDQNRVAIEGGGEGAADDAGAA
jgi:hypothetical protein